MSSETDLPPNPGPGSFSGGPSPYVSEKAPGFLQRFGWLYSSPRKSFQPPRPTAFWLTPMILISLLGLAGGVLLKDLGMEKQRTTIESNDQLSETQKEHALDQIDRMQKSPAMLVLSAVGAVIVVWLAVLIPALIYLLALNFGMGAQVRFVEVFGVSAFASLVGFPRDLIKIPLMAVKRSLEVYFSPAALVDSEHKVLIALLNRFDPFDLYQIAVLTLGFAVISGLPAKKTWIPVVVVWLLAGLVQVALSASPVMRMSR